jgi:GNAT superfamily N-acetyltransferase
MGEPEVVEVVEVTGPGCTAAQLAQLAAIERARDAELYPERPDVGDDEVRLALFQFPAREPRRVWLATVGGEAAGSVVVALPQVTNVVQVYVDLTVVPALRGRGVGAALLHAALAAQAPDRRLVGTWVPETAGDVGERWCERLGLTFRQTERMSRLVVADLDPEQQRRWIDDAPARGLGYRVVSWRGPYPDELLPQICVAFDAMADAPRDDVEHEQPRATPALVRDGEASVRGLVDQFGSLAIAPDGAAAGITELGVNIARPALGDQGDTAVVPGHRGHALGRWLKAANLRAAIDAHPELVGVETYNAETNPWMLAINVEMGFRPYRRFACFQGERAGVLDALVASRARPRDGREAVTARGE